MKEEMKPSGYVSTMLTFHLHSVIWPHLTAVTRNEVQLHAQREMEVWALECAVLCLSTVAFRALVVVHIFCVTEKKSTEE